MRMPNQRSIDTQPRSVVAEVLQDSRAHLPVNAALRAEQSSVQALQSQPMHLDQALQTEQPSVLTSQARPSYLNLRAVRNQLPSLERLGQLTGVTWHNTGSALEELGIAFGVGATVINGLSTRWSQSSSENKVLPESAFDPICNLMEDKWRGSKPESNITNYSNGLGLYKNVQLGPPDGGWIPDLLSKCTLLNGSRIFSGEVGDRNQQLLPGSECATYFSFGRAAYGTPPEHPCRQPYASYSQQCVDGIRAVAGLHSAYTYEGLHSSICPSRTSFLYPDVYQKRPLEPRYKTITVPGEAIDKSGIVVTALGAASALLILGGKQLQMYGRRREARAQLQNPV